MESINKWLKKLVKYGIFILVYRVFVEQLKEAASQM